MKLRMHIEGLEQIKEVYHTLDMWKKYSAFDSEGLMVVSRDSIIFANAINTFDSPNYWIEIPFSRDGPIALQQFVDRGNSKQITLNADITSLLEALKSASIFGEVAMTIELKKADQQWFLDLQVNANDGDAFTYNKIARVEINTDRLDLLSQTGISVALEGAHNLEQMSKMMTGDMVGIELSCANKNFATKPANVDLIITCDDEELTSLYTKYAEVPIGAWDKKSGGTRKVVSCGVSKKAFADIVGNLKNEVQLWVTHDRSLGISSNNLHCRIPALV